MPLYGASCILTKIIIGGMSIMDQVKIAKQMIEFQKTTFDNTFNAMVILQEQPEWMVNTLLE